MEEGYLQIFEYRGIDPGHEVLQIFIGSSEVQLGEGGEDGACLRGRTSAVPLRERWRGFEPNGETFEVAQRREASDDRFG
jgi:hypothetical protein